MLIGWKRRLDSAIEAAKEKTAEDRTSNIIRIDSLIETTKAPSRSALLDAISERISSGSLSVIYKIISPTSKSVIAEYYSAREIPETIYDSTVGHDIVVDPLSNIEIAFRVNPDA